MAPKHPKNSLVIRLTESVVFLRGSVDAAVRGRSVAQEAHGQPAMLRGLLTLTLVKPTKISSIEIKLEGKTSTSWPEGMGARRIEVSEEHSILSASTVFFRAGSSRSPSRRTRSVGPGLTLDRDDEEDSSGRDESTHVLQPRRPWAEPRSRTLSADQSMLQTDIVSHSANDAMTPPYTPTLISPAISGPSRTQSWTSNSSPSRAPDDSPGPAPSQQLEGFRNALRTELETAPIPVPLPRPRPQSYSPVSSVVPLSRRETAEDDLPSPQSRSRSPSRAPGVSRGRGSGRESAQSTAPSSPTVRSGDAMNAPAGPSRAQSQSPSVHHAFEDTRGRTPRSSRFSFAAVSSVLLDAVKDSVRVRSSSPRTRDGGMGLSRDRSPEREREEEREGGPERGRSREKGSGKEKEKDGLKLGKKLGGVIGRNGEDSGSEGWKEFRQGTYTYPISFAIPSNTPPTLHCDNGTVNYQLKATVHRPGAFTTKLTTRREVTLIACPGEDDLDESDNIVVQRQWENQMHYVIVVTGRTFPIGSVIPLHITLVPTSELKIYRITAVLEERVDYYTQFKRVARSDIPRRFELLTLRYSDKDTIPLLPLQTDYASSPLHGMIDFGLFEDSKDAEEAAATMIRGPGPWTLIKELQLPTSCGRMHFTNKNKKSNMGISHVLKIVLRVERGDDEVLDAKTGKRKLFDIVVLTPVHILSCRCNAEWTMLPRYSTFASEPHAKTQSCMCHFKRRGSTVTVDDLAPLTNGHAHPNSTPRAGPSYSPPLSRATSAQTPQTPYSAGGPLGRAVSLTPSDVESLYNRNSQFARLVAGQESELGEEPPRYDHVANIPPSIPEH
ncbi:hypothetical protein BD410DRAFT_839307 [Rickenella mellea]|uniref:Arrestin C-terminal-like domain-containing protein n=1 Tax=Rickenella mellea TaxID=50990 RepID=A0A4Y7Q7W6_9AGAM|nr:hypothetical protein BD410DRAFT_839307 [Rickenella mellea]